MKKLFAVLFCTFVIAGCKQGGSVDCGDPRVTCSLSPVNINTYEIDPVATAAAPWEVGERIVEEGICEGTHFAREFLGITQSGLALMQEFYLSGEKFTNPFLMHMKNENSLTDPSCTRNIEGHYIQWYKNGKKDFEANIKNGRGDGFVTGWHENGQKKKEGNFKNRKMVGIWLYWDEKGNLIEERDYGRPKD